MSLAIIACGVATNSSVLTTTAAVPAGANLIFVIDDFEVGGSTPTVATIVDSAGQTLASGKYVLSPSGHGTNAGGGFAFMVSHYTVCSSLAMTIGSTIAVTWSSSPNAPEVALFAVTGADANPSTAVSGSGCSTGTATGNLSLAFTTADANVVIVGSNQATNGVSVPGNGTITNSGGSQNFVEQYNTTNANEIESIIPTGAVAVAGSQTVTILASTSQDYVLAATAIRAAVVGGAKSDIVPMIGGGRRPSNSTYLKLRERRPHDDALRSYG